MKLNNSPRPQSRMDVDFNKLAVFCQVVESGNYQRASEALHVTPSALSQTITSLEHTLGFPVFRRQGRRLIPTENGKRLHREFRSRQFSFLEVLSEIRGVDTQVTGILKVGAYHEFAKNRLAGAIKRFIGANPGADLKLVFDSPSRLQAALGQGQLDLCFSVFAASEKKTIRSTPLLEEELVLIAPPGLLGASPGFEQILKAPIVDYYYNHQVLGRWLALHFGKRPKKLPVRIFAASAEMVVALVSEGAGIGVVPRYLVHGDLRVVRPSARKLKDFIWLLERLDVSETPAHAAFRELVLSGLKAQ